MDHPCAPGHRHGRVAIGPACTVAGDVVATLALDPKMREVDFSRALYIDTETTGLMGGAGTVPFLIGTARFEAGQLMVRKLMLRQLGEEAPMLHLLAEEMREASCIISYNGKSFDWPLLRTRFVMNRVKAPPVPPHLDLLHCSRRVFKGRMERVRLVDMEREVLGFERVGDVSGAEIPGLYMDYLRGGDVAPIARIIEHNKNDLIALAALLAELVAQFEGVRPEDDPRDQLACARVAERAGDVELARGLAHAAAGGPLEVEGTAAEALLLAGRLARREGDVEGEERCLGKALKQAPAGTVLESRVRLELAKLYEHRKKDLARALRHAALTFPAEDEQACHKRVNRLEARIRALPPEARHD